MATRPNNYYPWAIQDVTDNITTDTWIRVPKDATWI